jgi:hypothetical protein
MLSKYAVTKLIPDSKHYINKDLSQPLSLIIHSKRCKWCKFNHSAWTQRLCYSVVYHSIVGRN